MSCYIRCVRFCYITCVALCYITYVMLRYNHVRCYVIYMLYNICNVMSCYVI